MNFGAGTLPASRHTQAWRLRNRPTARKPAVLIGSTALHCWQPQPPLQRLGQEDNQRQAEDSSIASDGIPPTSLQRGARYGWLTWIAQSLWCSAQQPSSCRSSRPAWLTALRTAILQVKQAVEASEAGLDRVLTLHEAL